MKRWLVPEVIQTSLMDCGPAALKAVLEGFGIRVGYDTLRDRCQTDVDGTSIDALAALGRELGLETHEVLVPRDSFLLPEADCLPAIVVTRTGAGTLHFKVVWSVVGPWVQVMDPAGGRRWVHKREFLDRMPDVSLPISESTWRRWAGSEAGLAPLRVKMRALRMREAAIDAELAAALDDASWHALGALDAAVRMVTALVEARALAKGREAERLVSSLVARARQTGPRDFTDAIPRRFWWATPTPDPAKLRLHGAVVVHFAPGATAPVLDDDERDRPRAAAAPVNEEASPLAQLFSIARRHHGRALALATTALAASALVTTTDALLLRGALEAGRQLTLGYQRAAGIAVLVVFAAIGLSLDLLATSIIQRVGRAIELRLRVALLEKLPRLEDRYLRSRPTSDMASRGHAMQTLRETPAVASRVLRAAFGLVATTAGIVWLDPRGWPLALSAAVASIAVSWIARRPMAESSMRLRTQASALDRFYLDALLGVTPVRAHNAERAVRREHESLLVEWARTARAVHAQSLGVQGVQLVTSTVLVITLVGAYVGRGGSTAALLLLVFWALRVPALGHELTLALVAFRDLRNVAARLFAPLGAPEAPAPSADDPIPSRGGAAITLRGVTVRAGGATILKDVTASIPAGAHVGIVGASGAGKSSLLSLLLGWLEASEGVVEVDGSPLTAARVARLRDETAWVDPAVHLFKRTLFENVTFSAGTDAAVLERLPRAMADADLTEVLETLPDGMQGEVGEAGVRLSGGQGQRVRLARALLREPCRLVLLDEPFRGLERERRRELLGRARARWKDATVILVSHDVSDTLDLDRVLVVDGGRIVEDGSPRELVKIDSRYRELAEADAALRAETWASGRFRNIYMRGGVVATGEA